MRSLAFRTAAGYVGGRRISNASFEARSSLSASAACLVASGMREALAALLGTPATLRLLEPAIPSPHAWAAILEDAALYRLRGDRADAALVVRPGDALALAGAAFGEPPERGRRPERPLSAIEADVVGRTLAALVPSLAAVCGGGERRLERVAAIAGFVTYFELAIETPVEARIGVALSRDPEPDRSGRFELGDLADVRLAPRVELGLGTMPAGAAAALAIGSIVPIPSTGALRGSLRVGGRTLATGTCGVLDGRYAFMTTGGGR